MTDSKPTGAETKIKNCCDTCVCDEYDQCPCEPDLKCCDSCACGSSATTGSCACGTEVDSLKGKNDALLRERDAAVQKVSTTIKHWKGEEGKWFTERKILQEKLNKCMQVCQLLTEGVKKGQSGGVYTLEEATTLYTHIKQLNETMATKAAEGGGK